MSSGTALSVELYLTVAQAGAELDVTEEAYKAGWDYPPRMGALGVISPRTCPRCPVNRILWWAIAGSVPGSGVSDGGVSVPDVRGPSRESL
ncbi:hypothetical protein BST46_27970, partial [Mycobacterium timonense]